MGKCLREEGKLVCDKHSCWMTRAASICHRKYYFWCLCSLCIYQQSVSEPSFRYSNSVSHFFMLEK